MNDIDLQPTLHTPLLDLRPLRAADWGALFAVASDPLVWAVHPAHDRWQEPVFRKFFEQGLASGGALVVTAPGTGEIIGYSRYDRTRAGPDEVEIGWTFLARAYWGGAPNRAMKRAMLTHALQFVPRVIFIVGAENHRSRRAMEKIGGRLEERPISTAASLPQGPHVTYVIDRESFAAGPLMQAEASAPPAGVIDVPFRESLAERAALSSGQTTRAVPRMPDTIPLYDTTRT
ncbi:MAG: GNAT family N-acetyltransferase [Pseudomonadota bacterium]